CLGVLQVGGVEALGKPVVDFGEHRARLVAPIGVAHEPREARRGAEFERLRTLLARNQNSLLEATLSPLTVGTLLRQEQLALYPIKLWFVEPFLSLIKQGQAFSYYFQALIGPFVIVLKLREIRIPPHTARVAG